jgi:hypothetical protein
MRARWRAKTVVHGYKKPQASHPEFEFPVADLIGFYPELYNAVSQVQDQIVSIKLGMSHMHASQCDHQQIGQRLMDAIDNQIFGRFALEFPCLASYPQRR